MIRGKYDQFIGLYEFEMGFSPKLCNLTTEWFDSETTKNHTIRVGGAPTKNKQDRESKLARASATNPQQSIVRKDEVLHSPHYLDVEKKDLKYIEIEDISVVQLPSIVLDMYRGYLSHCLESYMLEYDMTMDLYSQSHKIHRVREKQGYHVWHCENDTYEVRDRYLAYMTYLQVPEEGGETEFLHQSLRVKPVIGTTLIWPAQFTHMHRGNPPLKGIKTYITGWFHLIPKPANHAPDVL